MNKLLISTQYIYDKECFVFKQEGNFNPVFKEYCNKDHSGGFSGKFWYIEVLSAYSLELINSAAGVVDVFKMSTRARELLIKLRYYSKPILGSDCQIDLSVNHGLSSFLFTYNQNPFLSQLMVSLNRSQKTVAVITYKDSPIEKRIFSGELDWNMFSITRDRDLELLKGSLDLFDVVIVEEVNTAPAIKTKKCALLTYILGNKPAIIITSSPYKSLKISAMYCFLKALKCSQTKTLTLFKKAYTQRNLVSINMLKKQESTLFIFGNK